MISQKIMLTYSYHYGEAVNWFSENMPEAEVSKKAKCSILYFRWWAIFVYIQIQRFLCCIVTLQRELTEKISKRSNKLMNWKNITIVIMGIVVGLIELVIYAIIIVPYFKPVTITGKYSVYFYFGKKLCHNSWLSGG